MDKENGNQKRRQRVKWLPKEYKWDDQGAKREKKEGRSTEGIITEVKLGIQEKREEEGCMERKVHIDNKWWKIMTIYSKERKTTERRVEDAMKENMEDCILLGGNFNGRIGERGARNWEEERENGKIKSKDKVESAAGNN
jgi:hypothetical protein